MKLIVLFLVDELSCKINFRPIPKYLFFTHRNVNDYFNILFYNEASVCEKTL